MNRIYISGPMSGLPNKNRKAFNDANDVQIMAGALERIRENEAFSIPMWGAQHTLPISSALNLNHRVDRRQKAPDVRSLRQVGAAKAAGSRGLGIKKARMVIEFSFPDRRQRDPHNYTPTFKPLIDGFIDSGLLPDDDHEHLIGPDLRVTPELCPPLLGLPAMRMVFVLLAEKRGE